MTTVMLLRGLLQALMFFITTWVVQLSYEAWQAGQASTVVSALLNQGTQLTAAGLLYSLQTNEKGPLELQVLVPEFLSQLPLPPPAAYLPEVQPLSSDWTVTLGEHPTAMLAAKINQDTCMHFNQKQGFDGIPTTPPELRIAFCYGGSAPYTLVFNGGGTAATLTPLDPTSVGYPVLCPDGSTIDSGTCAPASQSDDESIWAPFKRFFEGIDPATTAELPALPSDTSTSASGEAVSPEVQTSVLVAIKTAFVSMNLPLPAALADLPTTAPPEPPPPESDAVLAENASTWIRFKQFMESVKMTLEAKMAGTPAASTAPIDSTPETTITEPPSPAP